MAVQQGHPLSHLQAPQLAMATDWNKRFMVQTMPGRAGKPLTPQQGSKMIWSKTPKQLMTYWEEWRATIRQRDTIAFNLAINSAPSPPLQTPDPAANAAKASFIAMMKPAAKATSLSG